VFFQWGFVNFGCIPFDHFVDFHHFVHQFPTSKYQLKRSSNFPDINGFRQVLVGLVHWAIAELHRRSVPWMLN